MNYCKIIKHCLKWDVKEESYKNSNFEFKRETGLGPNGTPFCGRWVLRASDGCYIAHNTYRDDLAQRNNLVLTD